MAERNGGGDINNSEKLHLRIGWQAVDKNIIRVKWVFRTKLNADNFINKHKTRLIVKGYT
jgi:hypothetical protein